MLTVCGTVMCGGEWLCTGMADWVWSVDRGGIVWSDWVLGTEGICPEGTLCWLGSP
jgi:hypothetical protein